MTPMESSKQRRLFSQGAGSRSPSRAESSCDDTTLLAKCEVWRAPGRCRTLGRQGSSLPCQGCRRSSRSGLFSGNKKDKDSMRRGPESSEPKAELRDSAFARRGASYQCESLWRPSKLRGHGGPWRPSVSSWGIPGWPQGGSQ